MSLGDEYYQTGDYVTAADWFRKAAAVDPATSAASSRSARRCSTAATSTAPRSPGRVPSRSIRPNVEAHYDLGFLYLNRAARRHGRRPARVESRSSSSPPTATSPRPSRPTSTPSQSFSPAPASCGAPLSRGEPAAVAAASAPRRRRPRPRSPRRPRGERPAMTPRRGWGSPSPWRSSPACLASPRPAACRSCRPTSATWWAPPVSSRRRRSFLHGLAFVPGFTAVFVAFWASIGAIGYVLADNAKFLRHAWRRAPRSSSASRWPASSTSAPSGATRPTPAGDGRRVARAAAPSPSARHRQPARSDPRLRPIGPLRRRSSPPAGAPASARSSAASSASPPTTPSVADGTVLLLAYAAGLAVPFLAVAMGATLGLPPARLGHPPPPRRLARERSAARRHRLPDDHQPARPPCDALHAARRLTEADEMAQTRRHAARRPAPCRPRPPRRRTASTRPSTGCGTSSPR